jgi:hypothetical protein
MKRGPKSLWLRNEEPTEEQLMSEIDEYFFGLWHTLRNPTLEDFVAAAKIFFAPVIRKALQRTKAEDRSIRKANRKRQVTRAKEKNTALVIAAQLREKRRDLRMPRRKSQLADLVSKELKRQGIIAKPNTVRHWLTDSLKK